MTPYRTATRYLLLGAIFLAGGVRPVVAEVKLPGLFADHMILQRDVAAPLWGTAAPGQRVTVTLAGEGPKTTVADRAGKWSVRLDAKPAGGPWTLTVQADGDAKPIELHDVFRGEVWLCSGQSNMEMAVADTIHAAQEIAGDDFPKIRIARVGQKFADTPQDACEVNWRTCQRQNISGCSAVAYFFARDIHRALGVPIAMIDASWGGTPIQTWVRLKTQQDIPELKTLVEQFAGSMVSPHQRPAVCYNGMIAPLQPYAIRGVLWYQGETNGNVPGAESYGLFLKTLITSWRTEWAEGDFAFLYVQLPSFGKPAEARYWPLLREAALQNLALPNTGMAVTRDIGDPFDVHPKNKRDVGKRLARWALATTYGKKLVPSGPLYQAMRAEKGRIVIRFTHVGDGLLAQGGEPLQGFVVAGADKRFVPAEARMEGTSVVVSSPRVASPVAVRYAWSASADGNLYNRERLPASPFRTDDWTP